MASNGFDPGAVMVAVETGANRLEEAADTYYSAVKEFEEAEESFELEMAKLRVQADLTASSAGTKKLPSQDRRRDIALTMLHKENAEVYTRYFAAKAAKEAQGVLYRALAAAVSARQSLLKALA